MEKKIREYEKFIEEASGKELTPNELTNLANLHQEMLINFQTERLIHLIITLFFVTISLIILAVTAWLLSSNGFSIMTLPMVIIAIIISTLTCFYVKHYYFLENHIQKLYKYIRKLHNK